LPELPEVETIVRGLRGPLQGLVIESIELFSTSMLGEVTADDFIAALTDSRIKKIERRGKYILFKLQKGQKSFTLAVHLRMTGSLIYYSRKPRNPLQHTRAIFLFHNESCLFFIDVRKFGTFKILDDNQKTIFFSCLGVEPLSSTFSQQTLQKLIEGEKTSIKAFLLNQKYICGIGNIYADEILYRSSLYPEKPLPKLSKKEIANLWHNIREVLMEGIKAGGTSTRDYRNAAGEKGDYQKHLLVYGKAGQKCRRCCSIIQRIKVAGRGTYYCPGCQQN
jgi:formamidopyrimidine-DNA glycosylase